MNRLPQLLILALSDFLGLAEVVRLSSTSKKFRQIFQGYYRIYERECKAIFTSELSLYWSSFYSEKELYVNKKPEVEESFKISRNSAQVWKNLTIRGLSLKSNWKSRFIFDQNSDENPIELLGQILFETLRSPEPNSPCLMKEDNCVEFHTIFQQIMYECLFRQQDIECGVKPKVSFAYLSSEEEACKKMLRKCFPSSHKIAQEILESEEKSVLFDLRWYKCRQTAPIQSKFQNCSDSEEISTIEPSAPSSPDFSLFKPRLCLESKKCKEKQLVKSPLLKLLQQLTETIRLHCQITVELIREQSEPCEKLHEYHLRWHGFVASMVTMDEILIPVTRLVNEAYSLLYPGFPCNPSFSILRLFINVWHNEVYGPLQEEIERDTIGLLKEFHQGVGEYAQRRNTQESKNKRHSLVTNFGKKDNHQKYKISQNNDGALVSEDVFTPRSPRLSISSEEKLIGPDQSEIGFKELFLDSKKTKIPNMESKKKEILNLILLDLQDFSLNEYNMHYICHSETVFGKPFERIRSLIFQEIKKFFSYSVEEFPSKHWNEIICEYYQILERIFPHTLLKDLVDLRSKYTRGFTRSRIYKNMKEQNKKLRRKGKGRRKTKSPSSTQASESDKVSGTREETQKVYSDRKLESPFKNFLKESIGKAEDVVVSLLSYINEEEPDLIDTFNECFEINEKFYNKAFSKNAYIENYKKPRGFPLELGENEAFLFSFGCQATYSQLKKMQENREEECKTTRNQVKKDLPSGTDMVLDSLELSHELPPIPSMMCSPSRASNKASMAQGQEDVRDQEVGALLESMDESSDFEISAQAKLSTNKKNLPNLSLNKNLSCGPVQSRKRTSENFRPAMKRARVDSGSSEISCSEFRINKPEEEVKDRSISRYLQRPLDGPAAPIMNRTASSSLFSSSPTKNLMRANVPFKSVSETCNKKPQAQLMFEIGEMEDLDEMDLDEVEEPSLQ